MALVAQSPIVLYLLRSLQGYASDGILKVIDDEELQARFRSSTRKKSLLKSNIFHSVHVFNSKRLDQVSSVEDFIIQLASKLYMCRLWSSYELNEFVFSSTIKVQLLETIQSIDQELALLDVRLTGKESHSEKCSALRIPTTTLSLIYLYNKCRVWNPLVENALKLIQSCIRVSNQSEVESAFTFPTAYGYLQYFETYSKKLSMITDNHLSIHNITKWGFNRFKMKRYVFSLQFENCFAPFDHFINLLYPTYLEYTMRTIVQSVWNRSSTSNTADYTKSSASLSIHKLIQEIFKSSEDLLVLNSRDRTHDLNLTRFVQVIKQSISEYKEKMVVSLSKMSSSSSQGYLQQGQLTDLLHTFYHHSSSSGTSSAQPKFNLLYQPIDEHEEEKLKLTQLLEKLQVVVQHHNNHDKNNLSEQLWRHSYDTFSPVVIEQIVLLLQSFLVSKVTVDDDDDTVTGSDDDEERDREAGKSDSKEHRMFIPQQEQLKHTIITPLQSILEQMQRTALHILRQEHTLKLHFTFLQRVFFLSETNLFDTFRSLVQHMVIFVSDTEDSLRERRTSTYHSLQPTLTAIFDEHKPKKGIQHFSITLLSLFEIASMMLTHEPEPEEHRSRVCKGCDESVLAHALTCLHIECHYTWPLSILFTQAIIARMQACQRTLLQILTAKWHVEAWWKAFISTPSKPKAIKKNHGVTPVVKSAEQLEYEHEIKRSKRVCQQILVSVQSLVNYLAGFLLNFIHSSCFHLLLRKVDRVSSINMVQYAFTECVEQIESMLSILHTAGWQLVYTKLTTALTELRGALVADYQHASPAHVSLALKIAEMSMDDLNTAHQLFINQILAWTTDHGRNVMIKFTNENGQEVEKEFKQRCSTLVEKTMEELQMHFLSRRQSVI